MGDTADDFDDCRSIGSNDTVIEDDFEVDEVIAERKVRGRALYLVKWQGYDLPECTWEPRTAFHDEDTLRKWNKKKVLIRQGKEARADVATIEKQMDECTTARKIRQSRRCKLREQRATQRARQDQTQLASDKHYDLSLIDADAQGTIDAPSKRRRLQKGRRPQLGVDSDSNDELSIPSPSQATRQSNVTESNLQADHSLSQAKQLAHIGMGMAEANVQRRVTSQIGPRRTPSFTHLPTPDDEDDDLSNQRQTDTAAPVALMHTNAQDQLMARDDKTGEDTLMSDGSLFGDNDTVMTEAVNESVPHHFDTIAIGDRDSTMTTASPSAGTAPSPVVSLEGRKDNSAKVFERRNSSGISMVSKPVEVRKSVVAGPANEPSTGLLSVGNSEWSIRRRWHHSQRVLQNNEIPDSTTLATIDARTGEVVREAEKRQSFQEPRVAEAAAGAPSLSLATGAYSGPSARRESTRDDACATGSNPPIHTNDARRESQPTATSTVYRPSSRKQYTCRKWLKNNSCKYGEHECLWSHELLDHWEPKKLQTCPYWSEFGRCKFTDELCEFYHMDQDPKHGFPPSDNPSRIQYSSELVQTLSIPAKEALNRFDAETMTNEDEYDARMRAFGIKYGHTPMITSDVTCRYWFRGDCQQARSCKYAHKAMAFIKSKGAETCKYWYDGHCKWSDAKCRFHHCFSNAEGLPMGFKYNRTCKDWMKGKCRHSDEDCDCYHVVWNPNTKEGDTDGYDAESGSEDDGVDMRSSDHFHSDSDNENLFEPASLIKRLSFDNAVQPGLLVYFRLSNPALLSSVSAQMRAIGLISFTSTCLAGDFRACVDLNCDVAYEGQVASATSSELSATKIQALNAFLDDYQTGLISVHGDKMIVIHSANDPGWNSLHKDPIAKSEGSVPFIAFTSSSLPSQLAKLEPAIEEMSHDDKDALASRLHVDTERLFDLGEGKSTQKSVFLMFPLQMTSEVRLLREYLEGKGIKVYDAQNHVSWKKFHSDAQVGKSILGGCVLWHSSVWNFWEIPWLHLALHRSSWNHFRMTASAKQEEVGGPFELVRLFPPGEISLLTDELFRQEPANALMIIEGYHCRAFGGKAGSQSGPLLYVRPGVLDFIATIRDESDRQGDTEKSAALTRAGSLMLEMLFPWTRRTQDTEATEGMDPLIASPPEEEVPDYDAWNVRKPQKATHILVQHFCLWTLSQTDNARRFFVVFPSKFAGFEDVSSEEEGEVPSPTTPHTPRTPFVDDTKKKEEQRGRSDGTKDPRIKKWQDTYRHVWFTTVDNHPVVVTKR